MDRFAAWSLGKPLDDPKERYSLLYATQPAHARPGIPRFVHVGTQDANDPPNEWEPRKTWDEFVGDNDLWVRDGSGKRFHGWGPPDSGRYVVDLSKPVPWAATIMQCEQAARQIGCAGIHLDTISRNCHWKEARPHIQDQALYENHARLICDTVTSPSSCSGWKQYYTNLAMLRKFDFIKYEGFRFSPDFDHPGWGGPRGAPFTWEDWFVCRKTPRCFGIMELVSRGRMPVIEAQYDPDWDDAKRERYATIAVVTACLANCYVAVHEDHVWRAPYWSGAHEKALKLGNPESGMPIRSRVGTWHRSFEHGEVMMNPTPKRVAGVEPNQAAILVWK